MTGQPAIDIRILLPMAFYTNTHFPDLFLQALNIGHLSVAFLASDLAVDMALVVKQHVFGHIIDLHPRRRRLGVEIAVLL